MPVDLLDGQLFVSSPLPVFFVLLASFLISSSAVARAAMADLPPRLVGRPLPMGRAGSLSLMPCSVLRGWPHGDAALTLVPDIVMHSAVSWRAPRSGSGPPVSSRPSVQHVASPSPSLLKDGVLVGEATAPTMRITGNTAAPAITSTNLRSETSGTRNRHSQRKATTSSSSEHQPLPLLTPRPLSAQHLTSATGPLISQISNDAT